MVTKAPTSKSTKTATKKVQPATKPVATVKKQTNATKPVVPSKPVGKIPAGAAYGTGKRKTAIARVWLFPGSGQLQVNDVPADDYFSTPFQSKVAQSPFFVLNLDNRFDAIVFVTGGGLISQADAVRHGVSRALLLVSADYRAPLKSAGFLTRDSRIKERKKYGRKRARKGFQFRKR